MIVVQMVLPLLYVIIGIVLTDIPQDSNSQADPKVISSQMFDSFDNRVEEIYTYSNHTGEGAGRHPCQRPDLNLHSF